MDFFCDKVFYSSTVLGPKQIHALNFIRMGLAIAKTPGVRKNAKLNTNWAFKSDAELKSIYIRLLAWLKSHKYGEYLTIQYLFSDKIARLLASQDHFICPVPS